MASSAFDRRLELLESSGQVSAAVRLQVAAYVDDCEAVFGLVLDESNASLMVTHLALALRRAQEGEVLQAPAEPVVDEILAHPEELDWTRERLELVGRRLSISLPDSEVLYMTAHLVALMIGSQRAQG